MLRILLTEIYIEALLVDEEQRRFDFRRSRATMAVAARYLTGKVDDS